MREASFHQNVGHKSWADPHRRKVPFSGLSCIITVTLAACFAGTIGCLSGGQRAVGTETGNAITSWTANLLEAERMEWLRGDILGLPAVAEPGPRDVEHVIALLRTHPSTLVRTHAARV